MRILIAEDEPNLRSVIKKTLEKHHYSVDACKDGEETLYYLSLADFDAVILDIMMPKLDGLAVLKQFRQSGKKTPVLLLSARDSIEDRVNGLDLGADDYLVKPFAMDELLARLRVMLRREAKSIDHIYRIANLTVNCNSHTVFRDETEIVLSSKEFSILEYLIRNQGIVLSRDKIEQNIWNYDYMGGSNVVDVYIRYLRKKIDENFEPKLIHTIRGVGYVLKE